MLMLNSLIFLKEIVIDFYIRKPLDKKDLIFIEQCLNNLIFLEKIEICLLKNDED